MDVRHNYSVTLGGAGATDTLANFDAHASRRALKWAEHQLAIFDEIETGPIQIRQSVKDERGKVRRIRGQIAFTGKQTGELRGELIVEIVFRFGLVH